LNGPEVFEQFLMADTEKQDELLLNESTSIYFQDRLGVDAYRQLLEIAKNRTQLRKAGHLAAGDAPNLIFVPGIMGSLLKAKVGAGVWWIDAARARDKINLLGLDPNGADPSDEKLHVVPFGLDLTYQGFLYAAYDSAGMMPVQHPYDWRKSLTESTGGLARQIEETWNSNGHKPVHVVAHSMGGLLVRATLMKHGERLKSRLGRIVFIATPHYGSPTIAYYVREHIRGTWAMWLLGRYLKPATFRSLWGALSLLPAPQGVYPGTRNGESHPCMNFNCYSAADWKLELNAVDSSNFQKALNHCEQFHRDLFESHQQLDASLIDSIAMIIGVGYEMPFRVELRPGLVYGTRTKVILDRDSTNRDQESDGSVPVASAMLEGLKDTRYVCGQHSALPNMPAVYKDVFRFLKGDPMQLSTTAAGALHGHLSLQSGTSSTVSYLDQSDDRHTKFRTEHRWTIEEPTDKEWQWLENELNGGRLPQFDRARLL
jgi:pimeloyl-ACP methyl ester carboxylesterase